jgi:hypothetical protein
MFGGKKRREREAQIQAALHQQQAGEAAAPENSRANLPQASRGHQSRREAAIDSAIDRVIDHNPALAGNPALASSMHELLREARDDPQGFKQRMRDLAASSGAAAFTLTPEGLVPLTGPGVRGAAGPTAPGDPGSFGAATPGVTPAAWDPATFGGQQAVPTAPQLPPVAESPGGHPLEQLDKLAKLHNSGALTDAEFEAEKRRILGG